MDPQNYNVPNQNSSYPNTSSPNLKIGKFNIPRKFVFLACAIVVVLVMSLVVMRFFGNNHDIQQGDQLRLTIGGEQINQDEINLMNEYYKEQVGEDFNQENTYRFIQDMYVENYVLKQSLQEYSIDFASLQPEIQAYSDQFHPSREYPPALKRMLAENAVMKKNILPQIGIQYVSGEVIQLMVSVAETTVEERAELEKVMLSRLEFYRQMASDGVEFNIVKSRVEQDGVLQSKPKITQRIFDFDDMTPDRPIFLGDDFFSKLFATSIGGVSEVFAVSGRNAVSYGFAQVTQMQGGENNSYQDWLEKQKQMIEVETN